MMLEGSFKPTVMFFGLTNSPAIFQMMIKKEKEYDKVVEEVVKRLVENNLYVKPEKCKWEVRKVEFLGVVIGLEGIKIEEEKIKEVVDWLTLKGVKDIQKFLGLANYY